MNNLVYSNVAGGYGQMSNQFPKHLRLQKSNQFDAVFKGDQISGSNPTIKIALKELVLLAQKRPSVINAANDSADFKIEVITDNYVVESGNTQPTQALEKSPRQTPRLGLVVSKKVGNSVVRNKAKRYLRECFRLTWHRYEDQLRHIDMIVIARPQMATMTFDECMSTWQYALNRLFKRLDTNKDKP